MKRAFTLVEALVLLAVVLIVAAIVWPGGHHGARDNARRASCASNLKQIGLAFAIYQQDAADQLPFVARTGSRGWGEDVQRYTKGWGIFHCPSASSGADQTSDYFYNARLDGAKWQSVGAPCCTIEGGDGPDDAPLSSSLSALPSDAQTNGYSFAQRHLGMANYLFVDGHVMWSKPEKISSSAPSRDGAWTFAVR